MAESLIYGVLQKIDTFVRGEVLQPISTKIMEKIAAISEVESSIEQIENEFIVMQAVICKADKCLTNDPPYLAWLEVRGVAQKIEDTIDEYAYLLGQASVNDSYFKKSTGFIKNLEAWDNLVTRIKRLEIDLEKIKSRSDRYGIAMAHDEDENNSTNSIISQNIINYSYLIDEDGIVGKVEEIKILNEWLTNDRRERTVISICSMGGMGKTTIVNYIYKKAGSSKEL